ncbi:DUF4262 domain-containing protein [Novosphingobium sp. 1949]|uniref:DUF4262 domain-containing protein n=1 Tax=Novosphingobium organovorum TaxID=2930092 RepID=A0ABT0BHK8_9SPHN|nr:DUF4262 domain-containing protein [Novosphingobium organovorum]MCJ2184524.1 DUF4262 domain-containing protein [Novosphingobium organovorum]
MLTALQAPTDLLDEPEKAFVDNVRQYGWTRTKILADEIGPGFSFTTGFWANVQQPELLIFSLKDEISHDVFWDLFRDGQKGEAIPVGVKTSAVFGNLPAYAFPVARRFYQEYLGWSGWFYGGSEEFPCLQIVWPDRSGIFPWEPEFDQEMIGDQTDLTEHGWLASLAD